MKKAQANARRHIYGSGAAGCGGKAEPTSAKNTGEPLPCPHCDRVFKQWGRFQEHLRSRHADQDQEPGQEEASSATAGAADGAAASDRAGPAGDDQQPARLPAAGGGGGPQGDSLGAAGDVRPDGKLAYLVKSPQTLLNEWCQKNKRPSARFKQIVVEGGCYHCRVVLPDAKDSKNDMVLWYRERAALTGLEAQQRAAVMGLHWVLGDRRLDRVLPAEFRQQWKELDEAAEERKARQKRQKEKEEHQKKLRRLRQPKQELQPVFMSESNRRLVESLLRVEAGTANGEAAPEAEGSSEELSDGPSDSDMAEGVEDQSLYKSSEYVAGDSGQTAEASDSSEDAWERPVDVFDAAGQESQASSTYKPTAASGAKDVRSRAELEAVLLQMGFTKRDAEQAAKERADLPSALDWLVLNVAEADLPAHFAPDSSQAAVQVLRRGQQRAARSGGLGDAHARAAAHLHAYGYPLESCRETLAAHGGDKEQALYQLFHKYVDIGEQHCQVTHSLTSEDLAELREEEKLAVKAIYGRDISFPSVSSISLVLPDIDGLTERVILELFCGQEYPMSTPVLGFQGGGWLPSFALELTRLTAARSRELVGSCMLYELACYAVDEIPSLLARASQRADEASRAVSIAARVPSISRSEASGPGAQGGPPAAECDFEKPASAIRRTKATPLAASEHATRKESERLKLEWETWMSAPRHASLRAQRAKLPAVKERSAVIQAVEAGLVTIICGQTGCGKSTQVPQYILENAIEQGGGASCNIVCTQPRRLSAVGVADRVSQERGEPVGRTVGYSIRLENRRSSRTRLLFCTTGILLRRLLSDPDLTGVTHVIVDEVHERSVEGDLLLIVLRELLARQSVSRQSEVPLQLVLMSATIDTSVLAGYFVGFERKLDPSFVTIPGFTHPVQELFLDDALELTGFTIGRSSRHALKGKPAPHLQTQKPVSEIWDQDDDKAEHYSLPTMQSLSIVDEDSINYELIEVLLVSLVTNKVQIGHGGHGSSVGGAEAGAILVFLPGVGEIRRLQGALQRSSKLAKALDPSGAWILPLHGSLAGEDQKKVFQRPPKGMQKIVLATNVAETSITIDDVVYVVDSGKVKEMRYDHSRGLASLEECFISKASARQRAGRAGRVQPGCCIRLFSRRQYEKLDDHQLPEILRVSLEGLCLQIKSLLGGNIEETLSQALSPPSREAIAAALGALQAMQALDVDHNLTSLGQHLARMPVDARVGKMLILGSMLRCLHPVLTIAAALASRSPFLSPLDKRVEANAAKLKLAGSTKSDHMAVVVGYDGWEEAQQQGWAAERAYCDANFLSRETLVAMQASRADYASVLVDLGFAPQDYHRQLVASSSSLSDAVHVLDKESRSIRVVKAALCGGFYPNVLRVQHPEKTYAQTEGGTVVKDAAAHELRMYSKNDGRVFLHPSSVNFGVGHFESPWIVYSEKVKTSKVYIRETSMVPAYGLLLFGGGDIGVRHERKLISLDGWMEFEAPARIAVLIRELRGRVASLLADKIGNPALDISSSPVIASLVRLLATDGF
eukprot:SM000032S12044  [mRNA]  locus=s32:111779:119402:- [translate_table: standard]